MRNFVAYIFRSLMWWQLSHWLGHWDCSTWRRACGFFCFQDDPGNFWQVVSVHHVCPSVGCSWHEWVTNKGVIEREREQGGSHGMFYNLVLEVEHNNLPYSFSHTDEMVHYGRVLQKCADSSKLESLWAILESGYTSQSPIIIILKSSLFFWVKLKFFCACFPSLWQKTWTPFPLSLHTPTWFCFPWFSLIDCMLVPEQTIHTTKLTIFFFLLNFTILSFSGIETLPTL